MRKFFCLVCVLLPSLAPVSQAAEGLTAEVEHLLLAPKLSDVGVQNIFYLEDLLNSVQEFGSITSDTSYAQRLVLAYEGDNAGGAQIRWFTFDQDLDYSGVVEETPIVNLTGGVNLDVDAIDAEFTQRGEFHVWNWFATAGARYARLALREDSINFEDLIDTIWFGSTGVEFEGVGPTASVRGQRHIGKSGFSLFGSGRMSLLFGDTERFSAFRAGGSYVNPNEMVQVWELQMGSRFERRLQNFDLLTGIFWEAQRWDSDSNLLGDLGFHGFGVNTGLRY
ncbi:MAG: hypothetical protein KDB22_11155 [Planctomycetales bacterium]|nr:hypothetical protein [Planctomycetales bacterium]